MELSLENKIIENARMEKALETEKDDKETLRNYEAKAAVSKPVSIATQARERSTAIREYNRKIDEEELCAQELIKSRQQQLLKEQLQDMERARANKIQETDRELFDRKLRKNYIEDKVKTMKKIQDYERSRRRLEPQHMYKTCEDYVHRWNLFGKPLPVRPGSYFSGLFCTKLSTTTTSIC